MCETEQNVTTECLVTCECLYKNLNEMCYIHQKLRLELNINNILIFCLLYKIINIFKKHVFLVLIYSFFDNLCKLSILVSYILNIICVNNNDIQNILYEKLVKYLITYNLKAYYY